MKFTIELTETVIALAALVTGVLLGLLVVAILRTLRARRAQRALVTTITRCGVDHVRNVLAPDGNGGAVHLDFLLLTTRGLLVVDLREVRGNVFGSDQMAEWTIINGPQRTTFPNPQSSLFDRVAIVKQIAGAVPVDGRIVFTGRAFPKGLPRWTLTLDGLPSEYPMTDVEAARRIVAPWLADWDRVKTQVSDSPVTRLRAIFSSQLV
jgi:hypothetical protein